MHIMKKIIALAFLLLATSAAVAKNIKTAVFTTAPQMHCQNCENKIKGNLRFEKGVKKIETSIEAQTVTVTYDADKTTPEQLRKGFEKFGYQATTVKTAETKAAKAPAAKK